MSRQISKLTGLVSGFGRLSRLTVNLPQTGTDGATFVDLNKRASTASAPAKWTPSQWTSSAASNYQQPASGKVAATSSQEAELLVAKSAQQRTGSLFSVPDHQAYEPPDANCNGTMGEPLELVGLDVPDDISERSRSSARIDDIVQLAPAPPPPQASPPKLPTTGGFRAGIAGYLANKLSTLASLGCGNQQQQQQQQAASLSMPSSPAFSKRGQLNSAPATPIKLAKGTYHCQENHCSRSARSSLASRASMASQLTQAGPFEQMLAAIAQTTRDHGGCDFVLMLESSLSAKAASAASGSTRCSVAAQQNEQSNHQTTGASGPGGASSLVVSGGVGAPSSSTTLIIHLVAPSLQEKTAWISDISQVSLASRLRCRRARAQAPLVSVVVCLVLTAPSPKARPPRATVRAHLDCCRRAGRQMGPLLAGRLAPRMENNRASNSSFIRAYCWQDRAS